MSQPVIINFTIESYRNWLRAGRPPFEWFARQAADEQEALAQVGDEERLRAVIELAYTIRDPEAADAVVSGDEKAVEELTAKRMATEILNEVRKQVAPPIPAQPEPLRMGGLSARKPSKPPTTILGKAADK